MKHRTSNIELRTSKPDARGVVWVLERMNESAAQNFGVAQRIWSAATFRRFSAVTTCRHGSTAFSGAVNGQCAPAPTGLLRQSAEPLCAALPERQVAQATKAATSRRTPKLATRGFTLIEVLLAVGIFAIVLFAINTVFFSALKLERATSRIVDARAPLNLAFAILRHDIQGAVQPMTNSTLLPRHFTTGGRSGGLGSSQAGSLEFYTTTGVMSTDKPWSDLQKVRYELVAAADRTTGKGQDLVRVITRNNLATTTADEDEQILMSDVESVEFLCFNGSDWRSTWDTSSSDIGLPQAVKVRVQLASENQTKVSREPVELLVPITTVLLTNSLAGGAQ